MIRLLAIGVECGFSTLAFAHIAVLTDDTAMSTQPEHSTAVASTESADNARLTADRSSTIAQAEQAMVNRWAIHRRLYIWVMSFAHHRHSTLALFLLSFAESSFFPIPPDVLQIALTLERRNRAWFYATVSAVASVLGGVAGYMIGWGIWHLVDQFFFTYVPGFTPEVFAKVTDWYQQYDFWVVFTAAFTPIPYKVFTIGAGVCTISLPMFILASTVGRAGRFFMVAALLWWFGPPVRSFIDRYLNLLCIAITVLLIGGFVAIKFFR